MDHVIWTGCQILKLVSNVDIFIYFFCFLLDRKEGQIALQVFFNEITQPVFYILNGPQNTLHNNIKKNTTKIDEKQFQYLTPCPNDMIYTLLSLALSKALHKLEAHETSLGRVLSIVFLADSIDEDDSIEEAINALEVHSYIT